ncbi:rRNA-processing protein EBP2 [Kwoniella heveanensis CBS 569]|nr:rRNA-processing protein EBP2 [Kwoniella heveanensis CBS 569]
MVTLSKKEARKLKAGKGRADESAAKSTKVTKDVEEEVEDDSSEDEDENGVSEEGMQRLMELVNEEDLDEYERALLEGEDEDDDEDEELGSGEEVLSNEDSDEEDEDVEEDDELPVDNTIVDEKPDEDAISLDGLGSDVSVDEDAVPMRKITINNKPAMRIVTDAIKVTNMPWAEHLVLSSRETLDVDPSDDLQREMAFYKIALDCIPQAKKLAAKHDIPFTRPVDYYAEMVKSDEHMERVRTKLVEEAQGIKKSEAAKKQRDLKKFGKQIQHEKLKQREQDKKSFQDRVQGLKRKRQEGMEIGGDDDQFDIAVDDVIEDRPEKGERGGRGGRGGRGKDGKAKMPRHARDAKYSLGGSSRRAKQNTRESTNDFSSFGGGGRGGKGGRGGAGGGAKRGGGGGGRPGKSRRMAGRV